ncbi:MAG: hypothetical protein AABZ14_03780, partial [Candidatus Margulisiibacteriota bacterium]
VEAEGMSDEVRRQIFAVSVTALGAEGALQLLMGGEPSLSVQLKEMMLNELSDVDFDSLINSLVTSFTSGSTGLAAVLVNMISNDDLQKRVMDSIAMSSVISDDQKASILEALPSAENLQNRMFNALVTADPDSSWAQKLLLAGGYSDLILKLLANATTKSSISAIISENLGNANVQKFVFANAVSNPAVYAIAVKDAKLGDSSNLLSTIVSGLADSSTSMLLLDLLKETSLDLSTGNPAMKALVAKIGSGSVYDQFVLDNLTNKGIQTMLIRYSGNPNVSTLLTAQIKADALAGKRGSSSAIFSFMRDIATNGATWTSSDSRLAKEEPDSTKRVGLVKSLLSTLFGVFAEFMGTAGVSVEQEKCSSTLSKILFNSNDDDKRRAAGGALNIIEIMNDIQKTRYATWTLTYE